MKKIISLLYGGVILGLFPSHVYAATTGDIGQFTSNSLSILITLASLASVVFLVKGGFTYITSTGKPHEIEHAKRVIRNALIGLVLVIGAGIFSSLLHTAFQGNSIGGGTDTLSLAPLQPVTQGSGVTQVLIDAMSGFLQNIVQSATKPLVDSIIHFLTLTPSLSSNSVVFNFWLVITGIVDTLFAIGIALLGFHFMSASTFGFEELELKQLFPRIGLAFLGANTSLFFIDWIISLCNVLIQGVLATTGGIEKAWILNAFDPASLSTGPIAPTLLTLIFMIVFILLSVVLLIFYITRLITLSVGAVLSPFIFLLWVLPGFADFAKISIKAYLITIFTLFIHVVIIQLSSAFLTIPGQVGTNSIISILVGIAMLFTLLKVPGMMLQMAFYSAANRAVRKLGGQIINVATTSVPRERTADQVTTPRRTVTL